nr:uroporphyrinogen-III synthase [Actinomycetota bacterium]
MAAPVSLAPLDGFTVGVTADRRAEEQIELLQRRGATAVHAATIRTIPLTNHREVRTATEALIADPPAIVVLLTGLGTRGWLAAAESWDLDEALLACLTRARILARGPKAAGAGLTVGLAASWSAPSERSTEVVQELAREALDGVRIAVQRDGDERPFVAEALAARGADVVDVPVYRWVLPDDLLPAQRLVEDVSGGRVDAVTFTSSPALANFLRIADDLDRRAAAVAALSGPVVAACVGPVCAERAQAEGMTAVVVPRT